MHIAHSLSISQIYALSISTPPLQRRENQIKMTSFLLCLSHSHFYLLSLFSADIQELARQNKITKQILEAFIQKKLGLSREKIRAPSVQDILPVMKHQEDRITRDTPEDGLQEGQEYIEDDSLQSVESEQIPSFYSESGILFAIYILVKHNVDYVRIYTEESFEGENQCIFCP
ncbi:hypothetical protein O0L34_g16768 [Tuta absoluta]|nr:hypothetical protein O0L34_g16768 [Tuta absoluta]